MEVCVASWASTVWGAGRWRMTALSIGELAERDAEDLGGLPAGVVVGAGLADLGWAATGYDMP
jgi:hypothetical protein